MSTTTTDTQQTLAQKLDRLKSYIDELYTENIPLCDKPTTVYLGPTKGSVKLDSLRQTIGMGSSMVSHRFGPNEDVWSFPDGVEEKIEGDKIYKYWYTVYSPSDPYDMSSYYHVYYIELVSPERFAIRDFLAEQLEKFK